jgi:hypothetical protein
MRNHAPIFDKGVRLNSRIRPFDIIPTNYYQWFLDMFQSGKRILPPSHGGTVQAVKTITKVGTAIQFDIRLLQEYPENIISHKYLSGKRIVRTNSKTWIDKGCFDNIGEVSIVENSPVFADLQADKLCLAVGNETTKFDYMAESVMIADNKIYVKNGAYLSELVITKFGDRFIASIGQVWDIMPNASKLFDGLVVQNMLGKPFFVIPGICKIKIAELEGYRLITAKRSGRVVILIANKDGQDYQFVILFNKQFDGYTCSIETTLTKDINIAVLEKMLLVSILEDGTLDVVSVVSNQGKKITDANIKAIWNLSAEGNSVVFFVENKLYQVKMK